MRYAKIIGTIIVVAILGGGYWFISSNVKAVSRVGVVANRADVNATEALGILKDQFAEDGTTLTQEGLLTRYTRFSGTLSELLGFGFDKDGRPEVTEDGYLGRLDKVEKTLEQMAKTSDLYSLAQAVDKRIKPIESWQQAEANQRKAARLAAIKRENELVKKELAEIKGLNPGFAYASKSPAEIDALLKDGKTDFEQAVHTEMAHLSVNVSATATATVAQPATAFATKEELRATDAKAQAAIDANWALAQPTSWHERSLPKAHKKEARMHDEPYRK